MGKILEVETNLLKKAPWNYKTENEDQQAKLTESIKKNGFTVNLVVREVGKGYEVIDGNHRVDVLKELKIKKVHVYNYGKISKEEARQKAVEINENKFEADLFDLAKIFVDSSLTDSQLAETMPYSEQEIKDIKEILLFDWDEMNLEDEEMDVEIDTETIDETVTLSYPPEKQSEAEDAINELVRVYTYINIV